MVAQTHMGQRARKAREQDVHSTATARTQLAQTYPLQLALFQTFFSDKNPSDDATAAESYSNTIELYDAIPKYMAHPKVQGAKLERDFVHRGTAYTVQIWPAHFEARDRSEKKHIPPNLVVECVSHHRKPPEVRICRLSIQSAVGTRPPSTSTPHCPACRARRW